MSTISKVYSTEEVEANLKKLGIRPRTFFTHKSRKMEDVISDLAKKWHKYSDEEKGLVYDMFGFVGVGKKEDK